MRHCATHMRRSPARSRTTARPPAASRRILYAGLGLLGCLLVLGACQKHKPRPSPEARRAADSLVKTAKDIPTLVRLHEAFEHKGNRLGVLLSLKEWGRMLRNESRFEEALHQHSQALKLAEALGDTLEWVQVLNDIGTDYRRMGVLDVAQEYHYKARSLSEEHSDTTFQARKNRVVALNGLGNIYMTFGNYQQAEQVLRLALAGEQQLGSALGQAINYANLGAIFERQGQVDSAWRYYRHSMQLNREIGNQLGISLCHTHFGNLYERAKDYPRAVKEYETAYELMKASKDEWHALSSLIALAGIHNRLEDNARVEDYLAQAKAIAERIRSKEHLAEIYALYHRYYSRRGLYQQALASKEQADALQDSVISIEKINRIQNASINIERSRQRQQMDVVQLKLRQEKTKWEIGFGIFLLTLIVLVAVMVVLLYIQKLRARNHRTLKQMSALRESFFTNITHEFRTPLTLILGLSHDLQQEPDCSPELRDKVQIIERQGKSLLNLINQLLDIARTKSAVGDSDWYSGDISARLTMIVETYRDFAESRHIALSYEGPGRMEMDFVPDYLDKVMNNLLSNALKFTPEGGWVRVRSGQEAGKFVLEVADSGIGIAPEALEHIFEPFFQADGQSRKLGSGVGLALVRQILDAVGGQIEVKSQLGVGTRFVIQIPIRHENRPPLPSMGQAVPLDLEHLAETPPRDEDCRILIVEDNPDVAHYMGSLLCQRYSVYYASDGRQGVERALELMPDLIITDLMMPELDGFELCQQIRTSPITDHIPIIVVTAKISDKERIRGFEVGADAYLAKPFNSDELRALVERQLERHRCLRQRLSETPSDSKAPLIQLSDAEQRFLNRTDDFIQHALRNRRRIEVNTLAEQLCMSPRQLHRKLVALTGYPPTAYILNHKMLRAKELLESTPELTIEDIAERCGFEHDSSFYHAFKRHYGVTPAEYRKDSPAC